MTTGSAYANIVLKRLLDHDHFKTYFFDYLRELFQTSILYTWTKDGTFGSTRVVISASGNDEFDLDAQIGTDGVGHFLEPDSYCQDVKFENTDTIIYDIGLHYAEKPDGVQNNPRTGAPEYLRWEEAIGFADTPAAVDDLGGGDVRVTLPTSMCDNDRYHGGRKAVVWKVTPLTQEDAVAIQELTVYQLTGKQRITATGYLGGSSFDSTVANYRVLLLGPTVTRRTEKNLEGASGYWFIGQIEGDGSGNPPINPDNSGQRLIEYSLSDFIQVTSDNLYRIKAQSIGNWYNGVELASGGDYRVNDAVGYRSGTATTAGASYWTVVGEDDGVDAQIYSTDGKIWTERANPKAVDLNGITYDPLNDILIAVGDADGSDAYIVTAPYPHGTWTERANPKNVALIKIATNGLGTSIAVGANDGSDVYTVKTTNGTSFSEISIGGSGDIGEDIAYGEPSGVPTWVVAGRNGSNPKAWYSTDGSTFNSITIPGSFTDQCVSVAWNGRRFMILGASGDVMTSEDGQSWNYHFNFFGSPDNVRGDVHNHVFLASTGSQLWGSMDDGVTWQRVPHQPHRVGDTINVPNRVAHDGHGWLLYEVEFTDDKLVTIFSGNTWF